MSSPQIFDPQAADPRTVDILIIGSGMAGLAAARLAQAAGRSVCIFDKGRRIGGRVSTRRAAGFTFNHGAQFLTARQSEFISACTAAQSAGALAPWRVSGRDAFCGAPTMRDLPVFLGEGLTIRQQVEITEMTRDDGLVTLHDANGPVARGRQALVTAPAPQAARLLDGVAADLAATARGAAYAPCWTAMYGFDEEELPDMHEPVGADSGPVGWACWEAGRPAFAAGRAGAALTVQAAPDWSEAVLESDASAIAEAMLAGWQAMVGAPLPQPRYIAAHRWRYARVIQPAASDAPRRSADGMIAIAGDWVVGARVEDAFMSGHGAMSSLLGINAET
ncbi:MAG: FAD-dependent oxidoreductase [Pseudomonadota bacterium]|nr:FAD-dependent oxidoreductase [Pseudomonadota bacterium]